MGFYSYLYNKTKKVIVYNNCCDWKNNYSCDKHSVMHRYKWEITDEIYLLAGCASSMLKHDENTNTMEIDEKDDFCGRKNFQINNKYYLVYHN